ncbi:lantibiotic dehydratase [Modestobacter sp. VKM Ac-2977]|uniref:lantibiotic dehydratase n=1 Tax=Modestobacter sp. VKM Ac-2977 TaxID=3004131 RepID=UPI0022AB43C4|nr:lantibiotic dehydratase [Modestobacter sp. VKM Ac-2977]MCZ2819833.1 lantibiotic dehydratase [Modestobacter sp. VKM Ac-2977]
MTVLDRRAAVVNPDFVTRTAGLPYRVVEGLHSPRAAAWARQVVELDGSLAATATELSDGLQEAIGGNDDPRVRRDLIALRRDVHNLRVPRRPESLVASLATLDDGLAARAQAWLACAAQRAELIVQGPGLLSADQAAARAHLTQIAQDGRFQRGLMVASPDLDAQLADLLQAGDGRLSKRARRQERSLVRYVYRTACKTSPFSSLTSVALGTFTSGTDEVITSEGSLQDLVGHVRLNIGVLPRLVEAIRRHDQHKLDLPVQLVSGWRRHASRVRYVRRQRSVGDPDAAVTIDTMQDQLFFLSSGAFMTTLLELFTEVPAMPLGEVRTELERRLHGRVTAEDVVRFVDTLVRLDLLVVPELRVDLHADDPVAAFQQGLRALHLPWTADLLAALDRVRALTAEFGSATPARRRVLVSLVRSELTQQLRDLGAEDLEVPRALLYEDTSPRGLVTRASAEVFTDRFAPDLERISRILPCFDALLPQRHLLRAFFRIRFGTAGVCHDLIKFVHDFHLDIFDEYLKTSVGQGGPDDDGMPAPLPNWLDIPEVAQLDRGRRELVLAMREAYAGHEESDPELVLPSGFFERVAAALPADIEELDPRSFFAQFAGAGPDARLVMNRTYTGLTLLFSRFAHCLDEAAEERESVVRRLREHLLDLQPEGAVFAEMTGGIDTSNLNLHPAVTPYELVSPGDSSSRPRAEQINVDELQVRHDPDTDTVQLFEPRLGKRVIPVYLGFLMPFALSDVQRTLLLFSFQRMAQLDLWTGTDKPLGDREIASHPRVRHGDVVLVRKTWKTDPRRLPQPTGLSDAEWYLEWQRWRSRHDVPRHVFATLSAGGEVEQEPDHGPDAHDVAKPGATRGKPQYVDFESHYCLALLKEMVQQGASRLVLTEMLPGPGDLWVDSPDGAHVSEQTIEMTFTRRA